MPEIPGEVPIRVFCHAIMDIAVKLADAIRLDVETLRNDQKSVNLHFQGPTMELHWTTSDKYEILGLSRWSGDANWAVTLTKEIGGCPKKENLVTGGGKWVTFSDEK